MALYEYDLYLVREASRGDIARDLFAAGLIEPAGDTVVQLPFGVHAEWIEAESPAQPGTPLRILKLELEGSELEEVLKLNPDSFVGWLWAVAERADIAYAFMSSGSYAAYYETGGITNAMVLRQVGELVESGTVRIVHPVMFFAERLGAGRACARAQNAPMYVVLTRDGVGCLLLLIFGNPERGPMEILDPGTAYGQIRHHFDPSGARGKV